jgi:general secretion pathway protein N
MRLPALLFLGIASYLFFLLYNLPAPQVIGWLGLNEQAREVMLEGADGTVWSGEAKRLSYQRKPLGQINWSFLPSRLLLGKLAFDIELEDQGQQLQGRLVIGWGENLRLEHVEALLLASELPEWLQQRQVRIDDKVRLEEFDLTLTQGRVTAADGKVQWLGGALQSPLNLALGDLQADLSTDDESGDITAQIKDLKGSIGIAAEVRLKPDGNFQLDGSLKPGDKADPGLTGALQAIGRKQPDGSIQLKYAGKI